MSDFVRAYTKALLDTYNSTIARELTYRTPLKLLLEQLDSEIQALSDPARRKAGAPDYVIQRGVMPIGFIETKDIGVSLDAAEKSEQLMRYRENLGNLILTDYLEFRWYLDGEHVETVSIGKLEGKHCYFDTENYAALNSLLGRFLVASVPEVLNTEDLARRMARVAREMTRLIENTLKDTTNPSTQLIAQRDFFEQELISRLTDRQFADMFAQTIAYGMFAARVRFTDKPEKFTLEKAFFALPATNPFLQSFFQEIAKNLDERVKWLAEYLARVLAYANMDEILKHFGKNTAQTDPVIHFYETFLLAYDPGQKVDKGVYYTPEPVVRYMVKSVDHVLKTHFTHENGQPNTGLRDSRTLILDPATGTGTFLYFTIRHIYEQMVTLGGQAG
ncbi:MAG: N-6 DNA methylase, partial [Aggregatilineales bacterium]